MPQSEMKSFTEYLTFETRKRREMVHITDKVEQIVKRSGVKDGLCFVSPMHITAAIYVNDLENGLIEDIGKWLEELAPARPDYKHHQTGEDNGDAHLKSLLLHHETTLPVTGGRLDLGTWQRVFYAEFDGQRRKRVIVKVLESRSPELRVDKPSPPRLVIGTGVCQIENRARHYHQIDSTILGAAFGCGVVGDRVVLGVASGGELSWRDSSYLEQHTRNMYGARRGEFPVGVELGIVDRNVIRVSFHAKVIGSSVDRFGNLLESLRCFRPWDGSAGVEEAGLTQADDQAVARKLNGDNLSRNLNGQPLLKVTTHVLKVSSDF
jgi:secondary thiamine-phosphate synthase enzyme